MFSFFSILCRCYFQFELVFSHFCIFISFGKVTWWIGWRGMIDKTSIEVGIWISSRLILTIQFGELSFNPWLLQGFLVVFESITNFNCFKLKLPFIVWIRLDVFQQARLLWLYQIGCLLDCCVNFSLESIFLTFNQSCVLSDFHCFTFSLIQHLKRNAITCFMKMTFQALMFLCTKQTLIKR